MNSLLIIFIILNGLAFVCGFIWTGLDCTQLNQEDKMVRMNYRLPITYIFPGFLVGHYLMRALMTELF